MGKGIKIILSTLSAVILTLIILPVLIYFLLSIQPIQDLCAKYATSWLSKKLETTVKVDKLNLKLFNKITLDGLYIEDYHKDTLFYAKQITVPVQGLTIKPMEISLGEVKLEKPTFYLIADSVSGKTNLTQILGKLKSQKPKQKKGGVFKLTATACDIDSMRFKYRKKEIKVQNGGVNFTDIDVKDFTLKTNNVSVINDSISVNIEHIALSEKSGLVIDRLNTRNFTISSYGMFFRKLNLHTPASDLHMNRLSFTTGTWKGYSNFIDSVKLDAEIVNSTISFATIANFAPTLKNWQTVFRNVNGNVRGPISAMEGNLTNVETLETKISTGFGIYGIPDIKNTRFDLKIKSLQTNAKDIEFITKDIIGKPLGNVSKWIRKMNNLSFSGDFDGLFSNFRANGKLSTKQGQMNLNLNFTPASSRNTAFTGKLQTADFNIGELLDVNKLGRFTLTANVKGTYGADSLKLATTAEMPKIRYNDYTYEGISINGEFANRTFTGKIGSTDPNIIFDFDGKLSLSGTQPAYNFDLDLKNCDLHKLNFNKRDSVSIIRGRLTASGEGIVLDSVNAKATIDGMTYINHIDTVKAGKIDLLAQNNESGKLLGLYSSFADVEFRGKLGYDKMISYFHNTLLSYLPSISGSQRAQSPPQVSGAADINSYYLLTVNVKEANRVAGIFMPSLELAQGTKLSFLFNPESDVFSLVLDAEYIQQGDNFFVSNLSVNSRNQADSILLFVRAEDLFVKGLYMPNFSVIGSAKNNKVNMATRFSNTENGTSALLSTTSTLYKDSISGIPQLSININPSYISSDRQRWNIDAKSILYDSTRINFDNFRIYSGDQSLSINGTASRQRSDTLKLRLNNFDLTPLSHITTRQGYTLSGLTNGYADMASVMDKGVIYANIRFDSMQVNNVPLPGTRFESNWDLQREQARFMLTELQTQDTVISGVFRPADKQYRAVLNIKGLNLSLLDPVLDGVIKDTRGSADARLTITNPNDKFTVNGTIHADSLATTIDYTNVRYSMQNADIDVRNSIMSLRNTLNDPNGRSGELDMRFNFANFRNLIYDLQIRPDNMQVLNTTLKENDMFYGKIYASGAASIKGDKNGVAMDITATTAGQSEFYMPLNSNNNISRADFIVFENPAQNTVSDSMSMLSRRKQILLGQKSKQKRGGSKLNIDLQLNVKPNTEVQLVIDPTTGDILKGRGNGALNIHVNPANNDFRIIGDYTITEGSYKFTLRNIVSRNFIIEPGSTIQWTGDPIDARLNISAIYKLKASLATLLSTNSQNYRHSTQVECILRLTDYLTSPTISFDIKVPNADPETQSRVAHAINSQEMMATQFLWLLAVKSFYSDSNTADQNLNIGAVGATLTGIEFVSSQISSLMSSERFSFVPKYNAKTDVSSSEWGGAIYGELIKDRLILDIDLSYDTGDNIPMNTRTANSVTGDATLSLLLDQEGDFRIRAFSRTIDRFDEYQGLQESGIGIFYRENFDNLKDLIKNIRGRFANKKQNKEYKTVEKSPPK